ncbi:outer membrane beta-barrel domain-containing protein [Arsukibacterium sp.]|uniref:outer membrane beta-barrel domain-containing protein n=1 Tax=Arsukibacterium sp. TaxID=1977258 RepID=UPI002FDA4D27
MATRVQSTFLILLALCSGALAAQSVTEQLEPQIKQSRLEPAKLDTENWSIALKGGVLSIEDFGSSGLVGLQLAYHLTEDFYLAASAAQAEAGLTSFERLSGSAPLLTDEQREWRFYGAELGYVLLPGRGFAFGNTAFYSSLSVFAGGGTVSFAGDDVFALKLGSQWRIYVTDWLALDMVFTDYMFDTTILAERKRTHNLSLALGLAVYF